MAPEVGGRLIVINQFPFFFDTPSDGIALDASGQHLFYTPLGGYNLWTIPSEVQTCFCGLEIAKAHALREAFSLKCVGARESHSEPRASKARDGKEDSQVCFFDKKHLDEAFQYPLMHYRSLNQGRARTKSTRPRALSAAR